ncbi:Crp/Fnr family transcriptional regulator [Sphingobium fuliginis]|jgi:CRP/FNR family transcriptional regulator|nr:Crp/Fnr family transcriptional regulator [Sphingobium fuliginis]
MAEIPMHRLTEFAGPSAADLDFFKGLCGPERALPRRSIIRAQGDPVEQIYLLSEGWVTSSVDLRNGERQIVKIHIPGDVLGAPSLALESAADTLIAVTDVKIRAMPLNALGRIFKETPALAASLFLSAQQERVFLMERLASVGRMPAMNRLVVLLLHVHDRLVVLGHTKGLIEWPLTQTDIGDALGLTTVHVNRMMRALKGEGLVDRRGSILRLYDIEALRRLAGLSDRHWISRPDWLAKIAL